jgi:hypothetical protein
MGNCCMVFVHVNENENENENERNEKGGIREKSERTISDTAAASEERNSSILFLRVRKLFDNKSKCSWDVCSRADA